MQVFSCRVVGVSNSFIPNCVVRKDHTQHTDAICCRYSTNTYKTRKLLFIVIHPSVRIMR